MTQRGDFAPFSNMKIMINAPADKSSPAVFRCDPNFEDFFVRLQKKLRGTHRGFEFKIFSVDGNGIKSHSFFDGGESVSDGQLV
jgi:hypothetical protein